jgi:hypothetical protein
MKDEAYRPFVTDAHGNVVGFTAGPTPADLAAIRASMPPPPPPTMLDTEAYRLVGLDSFDAMQQGQLFGPDFECRNLGFPQPVPRKLIQDPDNWKEWKAAPLSWNRREVQKWVERVLPVAEHLVRLKQSGELDRLMDGTAITATRRATLTAAAGAVTALLMAFGLLG